MKITVRGKMAHILLLESTNVTDIIQDMLLHPPEKYGIEIHLNSNHEIISVILLGCGGSHENIMRILKFFIKKYEKTHNTIALQFLQIIKELRKSKPMYPKNFFRFDSE